MYEGLAFLSLWDPEAILLPVHCLVVSGFQQLSEACGVQLGLPIQRLDWSYD